MNFLFWILKVVLELICFGSFVKSKQNTTSLVPRNKTIGVSVETILERISFERFEAKSKVITKAS